MRNMHAISLGFTISLVLALTLLYHTRSRELSYPTRLPLHSSDGDTNSTQICIPIPLSPPPKQKDTKELWNYLWMLFEEHAPAQMFSPGEFPQGMVDNPPFKILDEFLPIEQLDAMGMRMTHGHLVGSLPDMPEKLFQGRGIVMVTSGLKAEFAATSLGTLRFIGSKLPVELWMLDRPTAKKGWCEELVHQGVACRYLEDYVDDAKKVFEDEDQQVGAAMLFSSFEEVLYLDGTTIPVAKPDDIFESEDYKDTGCILWFDFWRSTESPWTAYITGASQQKDTQQSEQQVVDGAQMVWHKRLQWKVRTLRFSLSFTIDVQEEYAAMLLHETPNSGHNPSSNRTFSHASKSVPNLDMCSITLCSCISIFCHMAIKLFQIHSYSSSETSSRSALHSVTYF